MVKGKLEDGTPFVIRFWHYQPRLKDTLTRARHGDKPFTEARVTIQGADGVRLLVARSVVHPNDNFCKETGRTLSLTRALSGEPRETRISVWDAYHHRGCDGGKCEGWD